MAQVDEIVDVIQNEGVDRAIQTIEEEIEDLIINHNVPSENIVSCSWYISGRSTDNLVCTVL